MWERCRPDLPAEYVAFGLLAVQTDDISNAQKVAHVDRSIFAPMLHGSPTIISSNHLSNHHANSCPVKQKTNKLEMRLLIRSNQYLIGFPVVCMSSAVIALWSGPQTVDNVEFGSV